MHHFSSATGKEGRHWSEMVPGLLYADADAKGRSVKINEVLFHLGLPDGPGSDPWPVDEAYEPPSQGEMVRSLAKELDRSKVQTALLAMEDMWKSSAGNWYSDDLTPMIAANFFPKTGGKSSVWSRDLMAWLTQEQNSSGSRTNAAGGAVTGGDNSRKKTPGPFNLKTIVVDASSLEVQATQELEAKSWYWRRSTGVATDLTALSEIHLQKLAAVRDFAQFLRDRVLEKRAEAAAGAAGNISHKGGYEYDDDMMDPLELDLDDVFVPDEDSPEDSSEEDGSPEARGAREADVDVLPSSALEKDAGAKEEVDERTITGEDEEARAGGSTEEEERRLIYPVDGSDNPIPFTSREAWLLFFHMMKLLHPKNNSASQVLWIGGRIGGTGSTILVDGDRRTPVFLWYLSDRGTGAVVIVGQGYCGFRRTGVFVLGLRYHPCPTNTAYL